MIDKTSPLPIYAQLEQLIKTQILQHQLKEGELIPSEREYAEKYQISRMTVRQAITRLTESGYLQRQRGKGTFVAMTKVEQPLNFLTSFSEDMCLKGMAARSQVVDFQVIEADSLLAEKLQIAVGTQIYQIKRLRFADDLPIAYQIFYATHALIQGLTKEIASHSLYQYMENELGLHLDYAEQEMEVRKAQKHEAEMLNIKVGSPLFFIQRTSFSPTNQPIEYAISYHLGDRYKFKVRINRSH